MTEISRRFYFDDVFVDTLQYFRDNVQPLVVFLNGAVDRNRSELPIFQRSSWADDVDYHCLFVSDPTLELDSELSIGWGIGDLKSHAIFAMCEAVQSVIDAKSELISGSPIFVGSSAGGFQALCMASRMRGSVLAINPQIRITDYFEKEVHNALRSSFGTRSTGLALSAYPERLDVFDYFRSEGHTPRVQIALNVASPDDMRRDNRRIVEWLSTSPELVHFFELKYYSKPELGHNPPSKDVTLKMISDFVNAIEE